MTKFTLGITAGVFFVFTCGVGFGAVVSPTAEQRDTRALQLRFKEALALELGPKVKTQVERFYMRDYAPENARIVNIHPHPAIGLVSLEYAWEEKGITRHAMASANVKAYAPIAVAKAAIRHQDIFSKDNVALEERELTPLRVAGFYDNLESLSPLRANGFLSPGMVVDFRHTQIPNLVSQGEMVDLVRETAAVKIVAKVRALESGKRNQWIRVENPYSKKVIQARVVDSGVVHLN